MRKILIVGSGQSGLQLALGLRHRGYDVTVMSVRTAEEIYGGQVTSTQCMFHDALSIERDEGLNLWESEAPHVDAITFTLADENGGQAIAWTGHLDGYAQSVDQRVKMSRWMRLFEERGGHLVVHGVTVSDLDRLVDLYDLVIVAAGKGEIVQLFDRDPARSPYTTPQRALAVVYVNGLTPREDRPDLRAVDFNLVPKVGELFVIPALTATGPCDILFFEGIPGGPLDAFTEVKSCEEHLDLTLDLMRRYVPWEHARCGSVRVTDPGGVLSGRYTPVVRKPVGELPSGGAVLGMADVVVANDPVTGQGSNNAARCAAVYLECILNHGNRPFDREFMTEAFDRYWLYASHVTAWTNAMLAPPPPHALELLAAGRDNPVVANRFVNGFSDPTDFANWFMDARRAREYLTAVSGGAPA